MLKRIRILGLDPSLRHTGWGVIDIKDGKIIHIEHGVIAPKQKMQPKQLYMIGKSIDDLFRKYKPHRIAIEETFCGINHKTNIKLGFALGSIMSALGKYNADINLYPTRIIKMHILKGNAKKDEIHNVIVNTLLIEVKTFDMSDALAAAMCDVITNKLCSPIEIRSS